MDIEIRNILIYAFDGAFTIFTTSFKRDIYSEMLKKLLLLISILFTQVVYSQVENVPLNDRVYTFLKEMKVKKIIPSFIDDISNLSRYEISEFLVQIREHYNELSTFVESITANHSAKSKTHELI